MLEPDVVRLPAELPDPLLKPAEVLFAVEVVAPSYRPVAPAVLAELAGPRRGV